MIIKEINIEGIEQNRYEVQLILADKSLRGDLFSVDEQGNEQGERLHSAVIEQKDGKYPFELTEDEINQINPTQNEKVLD